MKGAAKTSDLRPKRILEGLADVLEAFDDLVAQVDELSLLVDDIKQNLAEMAETRPELNMVLGPVKAGDRVNRPAPTPVASFPEVVTVNWPVSDRAELVIDGKQVVLSRKLGLLVEVLLKEAEPAGDSRGGWKSRAELAQALAERAGKPITKHALENLISRLRKELRQARFEPLLQCDSRLGVRLALRKHILGRAEGSS